MKASRKRPKGAFRRPFGLVLCVVTAMPNSIGHQDLAALIARQPAVTERWRAHVRNSTFGTIHAATLSFPRTLGASIPDPFFTQLAALDPRALEATGSIPLNVPIEPAVTAPVYDFPVVDRTRKGDRLNVKAPPDRPQPVRPQPATPAKTKDHARLPPASGPVPQAWPGQSAPDAAAALPALPKADRLPPPLVRTEDAAPAKVYRRAGIAAGQNTLAKRVLGTGPRPPLVVAAPVAPVEDKVLRRFGIAAGVKTLAKRVLGTGPRPPVVVAAPAAPVADKVLRRAGIAGEKTLAKRVLGTGPRPPLVVAAPVAPVADKVLRRAGIAAGEKTLAKRVLGTGPRPPLVVAAPATPVADKVLRRAGIAAGEKTLAKRVLGTGPRPSLAVAAPTAPVPVATVKSGTPAFTAKPRGSGLAAAQLKRIRKEVARTRAPLAETADLESARADLRGPIAPRQLAETADLESQRADLAGPIVPPPAAAAELPQVPAQTTERDTAPQIAEIRPEPVAPVDEAASTPAPQVADAPEPSPQVASVPPAAETVPDVPAKHADRFNAQAVEQLAQFANPGAQTRVFFGTRALGIGRSSWEAWEDDEVPTVLAPPHVDTEIKRAALDPVPDAETEKGGETIAPKGEVTGEGKRPRTPAERLNLTGAVRAKHSRCLANAIYFEARGEVERGQMAVAQVILNRAFSGYYPGNVCDVVYQNAHRHLACQFTFACDNHKDVVRDPPRWEIATRIADDALDGKFWLPEIGKATHYHATYVNPWWVRTMTKHAKLGVHIFYRPKRWGDGDDIPVWGDRLDVTGTIKREAAPAKPEKVGSDKRAEAEPRRSIFDPVEPIPPGG
ncbi:MAG: cell wall hydrolase [Pseudorhodoplanes sp.]|uniref:cell wall hydrolase n=1 Tax=Pseudorhodoplanes sp. TaxID=1934341 RepID=UPI003D0DEDE5